MERGSKVNLGLKKVTRPEQNLQAIFISRR